MFSGRNAFAPDLDIGYIAAGPDDIVSGVGSRTNDHYRDFQINNLDDITTVRYYFANDGSVENTQKSPLRRLSYPFAPLEALAVGVPDAPPQEGVFQDTFVETSIDNEGRVLFAAKGYGETAWKVYLVDPLESFVKPSDEPLVVVATDDFHLMAADDRQFVIGSRSGAGERIDLHAVHEILGVRSTAIATTSGRLWSRLGINPGIIA